jgi:hypothetical protein
MHVNLKVSTSEEYFLQTEREIDWEEENSFKIQLKQAQGLQEILATEVSIFMLRRATGFCGSLVDTMAGVRRKLIKKYENDYETYVEYNDFY